MTEEAVRQDASSIFEELREIQAAVKAKKLDKEKGEEQERALAYSFGELDPSAPPPQEYVDPVSKRRKMTPPARLPTLGQMRRPVPPPRTLGQLVEGAVWDFVTFGLASRSWAEGALSMNRKHYVKGQAMTHARFGKRLQGLQFIALLCILVIEIYGVYAAILHSLGQQPCGKGLRNMCKAPKCMEAVCPRTGYTAPPPWPPGYLG